MASGLPKQLGDFEILEELGSGGMGRVYLVRNIISDRIEAMKILLPDLAGRQELVTRFLREIKLLASLNHPNIAALRTALTTDNQLLMIMEYVEGITLAKRLERGPVAVTDALNYITQVLDALSYAHSRSITHRDIKPANMMLTPLGLVKLMDFGIARSDNDRTLTQTGITIGSLSYMSPEQVKGEAADTRSDLYSVGISLYEMATGQRPFSGSDFDLMTAQVKKNPKPPVELKPTLPVALNEIILKAIAKEPGSRFQSADAFRTALSQIQGLSPGRPAVPDIHDATTMDFVALKNSQDEPTANNRKGISAPTPPMVDAKVTPIPNAAGLTSAPVPPVAAVMPPTSRKSGHRGLYVALGAVIVLAVLVAAGFVPYQSRTATETFEPAVGEIPETAGTATSAAGPVQITAPPASSTPVNTPSKVNDAVSSPDTSDSNAAAAENSSGQSADDALTPASASGTTAGVTAAQASELDQLEREVDQLTARAGAVNSSVETLRRQQNAQGYGLRSDIASRNESMKINLIKAQDAIESGDAVRAKRYIQSTQSDVQAIERFLGR